MSYFTHKKYFLLALVFFFFLSVAILVSVYLFVNSGQQKNVDSTNTAVLLQHVGKLMDLPSGEKPQVVPITEVAPFKHQPFFYYAKEGDVLIVYLQKNVAILYDPKEDKIVNMNKISAAIFPPPAL